MTTKSNDFPSLKGLDVAIDTETTGLNLYRGDRVFGISLATSGFSGYWDVRRNPAVIKWLRDQVRYTRRAVFYNASFDYKGLSDLGIRIPMEKVYDACVRACLIDENLYSYELDDVAWRCIRRKKTSDIWPALAEIFGGRPTKNAQIGNLQHADPDLVATYAIPDAEITHELFLWQDGECHRQDLHDIFEFEQRLLPYTIQMEMRGVAVDEEEAEKRAKKLERQRVKIQRELNKTVGHEVNANPSKSLTEALAPYNKDGKWYAKDGTPLRETPGGKPQLDKKALVRMKMPEAKMVLQIRTLNRAVDVFLRGHVLASAVNGRVYPSIHQAKGPDGGTQTGRLSYSGPALQQLSARDEDMAREVRAVFVPYDTLDSWICRDYEQSDFRVMAHHAQPSKVLEAYADNPAADFHAVCSSITGVPRNPSYAGEANAKQINLGLVFGMGEGKSAAEMGMPYFIDEDGWMRAGPEAKKVFEVYHGELPEIRRFLDKAKKIARRRGYVRSLSGRHLRFPHRSEVYKAGGYIFQAGTADIIKKAIIDTHESGILEKYGAQVIITVHDELSLSCPKESSKECSVELANVMEHVYNLRVPLLTDGGVGPNWYKAK